MMVWSEKSISECPGCGRTCVVNIMSLSATCPIDGYFYADVREPHGGWYFSREHYANGGRPIPIFEAQKMIDCPFYGSFAFVDAGGVWRISTGGNQCSLATEAHVPCYLEAAGLPVDWQACDRIPRLVHLRLAEEPE